MKILILGSNGQVGFELTQIVDSAIALTRDQVDFSVPGQISEIIDQYKPDIVVNAVAYTAVDKAESEPSLAMLINAVAVQELARVCAKHDAWCIHYSTDYVFDGSADTPYKETDPVNPLGIYGQTKLAGERYIQAETDKHIILRTSWVYSWRGANFVKTMLRLADERESLNVVNDQHGCPTYAGDIALVTKHIIEQLNKNPQLNGIYHLTGSDSTTWFEFAKAIFECSGKTISLNPIATTEFPTPAKRPKYSILDNAKLESRFGLVLPGYKQSLNSCLDRIAFA